MRESAVCINCVYCLRCLGGGRRAAIGGRLVAKTSTVLKLQDGNEQSAKNKKPWYCEKESVKVGSVSSSQPASRSEAQKESAAPRHV